MSESERIIQAYIEQIYKLQEQHRNKPLEVDELNQIAQELGLSERDLDFIDQKFQDFLDRGLGFIRYENWDKAIEELQQAVNLKPLHIQALQELARAYYQRWRKVKNKKDKVQAQIFAERCLQVDARNEQALRLMHWLSTKPSPYLNRRSITRLTLILLGGVLLGVGIWLLLKIDFGIQGVSESTTPEGQVLNAITEDNYSEIALSLGDHINAHGFWLDKERSFLRKKDENLEYFIRASLVNDRYEISALHIDIQLLDDAQNVLEERSSQLLEEGALNIWPGDYIPISFSLRLEASIEQAKQAIISIKSLEKILAEEEETLLIPLVWDQRPGSGVDVVLRERSQAIDSEADQFNQSIFFSFENVGLKPIKKLAIAIEWLNNDGDIIHTQIETLVSEQGDPLLKPQHRRGFQKRFLIPYKLDDYASYRIRMKEIQIGD